jgi:hypothetical protein
MRPARIQAGPTPTADEQTVIFLHIGKTGGTTLRKILHRNIGPSEILLVRNPSRTPARLRREETLDLFAAIPEADRARPRLIEGHTIFGLHRFVPRPSTYITLLRHPVALAVSQYNWVRSDPTHWLHQQARAMTIDEYVDSGISLEIDNGQTRAISGDTTTAYGDCSRETLEIAKQNIEDHFSVVGLIERFDESLLLLRRAFGWSRLHYVPANFSLKRPGAAVSGGSLDHIAERNWLDIELHEFAARRLEGAMAEAPRFGSDLKRFRVANTIYRRAWGDLTYTIPKRMVMRLSGPGRAGR